MGIFSQKAKFKVAAPTIRVEKVLVDKTKAAPKPPATNSLWTGASAGKDKKAGSSSAGGSSPRPSPQLLARGKSKSKSASPLPSSSSVDDAEQRLRARKRKLTTRNGRSPAAARVKFDDDDSGSEDDEGWKDALNEHKRRRRNGYGDAAPLDLDRSLRHPAAFASVDEEEKEEDMKIIHARDVASLALGCAPALKLDADSVAVELQYPGARRREKYELVKGKDKIDAISDIIEVVKAVADNYLSEADSAPFLDPSTGFIRQLKRACSPNVCDAVAFKAALRDYNARVLALRQAGSIAAVLDQKHGVPLDLVQLIMRQVYDRTVAPKVELLTKYENGTDNVYGEMNAPFSSDILIRRTGMTSGQVFVDLGSGVGNVVLQAALQIGCESWGCEMMDNACALADAQLVEFKARCRLWGLAPGRVVLERGDFRTNARIHDALKRADVVLVNNQAFTSQLNDDLVRMFLDLKPGCRIVSLKTFVHEHKGSSHNVNDVGSTILDVEDFTYPEGYVSWTGAGGTYCVSTRR